MKPLLILTALTAAVYASLGHEDLRGRAVNHTTMNPTQLSVLAVLKTALAGVSLPTPGAPEPEWFAKLPEDVKSLLPKLYPATAMVAVTTVDARPTAASTSPSVTVSLPSVLSHNSTSSSATLAISEITITKSLQRASSVTGPGLLFPTSNGTLTTGAPSASATAPVVSGGARNSDEMKTLAAFLWITVGAGFCLFA